MAIDIKVPALGESVTEATVAQWLKKLGEAVQVEIDSPAIVGLRACRHGLRWAGGHVRVPLNNESSVPFPRRSRPRRSRA